MDWLNLLGTVISIVGLVYAWVVARQSNRQKILTYDITDPLPIASVLPDRVEHRLSIIFERDGAEPVNVKGAYLWLVTLGNLGRETITRDDIAPSDTLRIEVRDTRVLDISKAGISREVINFSVSQYEESTNKVTVSKLSFDFLDYEDAASIRILTDTAQAQINIAGTVIGMPKGIKPQDKPQAMITTLARIPFLQTILAAVSFTISFLFFRVLLCR